MTQPLFPAPAELDMPVGREAFTLPLLLLTVAALGGVRVAQGGALALVPPSLISLILSTVLAGALVRSRALLPGRLVNDRRRLLANGSGVVVEPPLSNKELLLASM